MRLFWKRRQQECDRREKEQCLDMDKAVIEISARLRFLEAVTAELVAGLHPSKRDHLLEHLGKVVGGLNALPPPMPVPPGHEQEFHTILRRALKVLIENSEPKVRRR
jgi:hypothetical protein